MVRQRLNEETIVLAVEVTNLEIDLVSQERALDRFFVMLANEFKSFQKVDFDQTWLVLVPSVVFDLSECHVAEVHRIAIRSSDLLLLLLLSIGCLSLLVDSCSSLSLLQESLNTLDFSIQYSLRVLSFSRGEKASELSQIALQIFNAKRKIVLN